jgi:hypothetical protein
MAMKTNTRIKAGMTKSQLIETVANKLKLPR